MTSSHSPPVLGRARTAGTDTYLKHPLFRCPGPRRLAKILHCSPNALERLAGRHDNYIDWSFISSKGKYRFVEQPKLSLENIHRRLAELVRRLDVPDYLHSGVRGRSAVTNARAHLGVAETIKVDLKRFFFSTEGHHVFHFFRHHLDVAGDAAGLLTRLSTSNNRLPIGSPLSEPLAFHCHRLLFDSIDRYARSRRGLFTLYVDDLTLSFDRVREADTRTLQGMIDRYGLKVSSATVYRRGEARVITGVKLEDGRAGVPDDLITRMHETRRAHARATSSTERFLTARKLAGQISFAAMLDRRLRQEAEDARELLRLHAIAETR